MKTAIITLLMVMLMTGCFNSEAPKCSNKDVQETVKGLYTQLLDNTSKNVLLSGLMGDLPKNITNMSSIRAVSYDETVKLRTCKADVQLDTNQSIQISYTVQLNEEDSDTFYVELDSGFLEGLVQKTMMKTIFNR
ncbi:MAG: hypothetical protein ACJAWW_001270 [Sulfurimonas sp.]|jgi:hypothetical protein